MAKISCYHLSLRQDRDIGGSTSEELKSVEQIPDSGTIAALAEMQRLTTRNDDDSTSAILVIEDPSALRAWVEMSSFNRSGESTNNQDSNTLSWDNKSVQAISIRVLAQWEAPGEPRWKRNLDSTVAPIFQSWREALRQIPQNAHPRLMIYDFQHKLHGENEDEARGFIQLVSTVLTVKSRHNKIRFALIGCSEDHRKLLGQGLDNLFEPGLAKQPTRAVPLWWEVAKMAGHPDIPRKKGKNVVAEDMSKVGYQPPRMSRQRREEEDG